MHRHFATHKMIRKKLLEILQTTSHEDLLCIPNGFNNNIYWNVAHCVATQQLLHYYLSKNPFRIDQYWVEQYKKGTLANFDIKPSEIEDMIYLLPETAKILKKDFEEGFFVEYNPYSTSIGIDLKDIQDAIAYNNFHESLHYGYILAQKRALMIAEEF